MKQRRRIYYTAIDKSLMWDRWQKGESLHSTASLFDRHHSSIIRMLRRKRQERGTVNYLVQEADTGP